jgi:uncharacterized Zn-finger protein
MNTLITVPHGCNCHAYPNGGPLEPQFPPGAGILLGDLTPMNNWCRVNGISVAPNLDSQRSAKDFLDELFMVGNSAPVYSGSLLNVIPYDTVSGAGNGAIFTAPTAAGPINLTDKDFYCDGKTPPVKLKRKRRTSCDNVVAIEFVDRSIDYAHNIASESDQRSVTLYGPRKGGALDTSMLGLRPASGTKSVLSLSNAVAADAIASILVKRSAAGLNHYFFTLNPEWYFLEAMDLVTLTRTDIGLNAVPVRLVSANEAPQRRLDCEAEEFIYGLDHPRVHPVTAATGSLVKTNIDPGLVNAPIIFEPPTAMLSGGATKQVWFLVSGTDPNYGGAVAYVSVDGGASYTGLGNCPAATMGVLTADYLVSAADPDTTDTLAVDLTESDGALSSQSQPIADGFADPCYVAGASGFEIVCFTTATLTAANKYNLTTYVRRGVFGTAAIDHPLGSAFAVCGGALEVNLPSQWEGKTLHFKFAAYNQLGGQQNDLSKCAVYTFTP